MAEVRKTVREDKYDTASIKKDTKGKTKSDKKAVINKKENSEKKKGIFARFCIFCNGVKSEFQKIHWTSKNDMLKYSIATVVFIIFFSVFFYGIDIVFALIKSLFN